MISLGLKYCKARFESRCWKNEREKEKEKGNKVEIGLIQKKNINFRLEFRYKKLAKFIYFRKLPKI